MWRWPILLLVTSVPALAEMQRDPGVALVPLPGFARTELLGDWFQVAQVPSLLNDNCHGTRVTVEARDDSRLTLRMTCPKGALGGPVLAIDGVLVELEPGWFQARFVRLSALGNLDLVVLGAGDGMVEIGAPQGQVGWIWSRQAHPDPAALDRAKAALVAAGYMPGAIAPVEQAP